MTLNTASLLGKTYRGRIAPSPTGYLHLGHARTFWTAFLRAREAGGVLVLRNDDLDQQRSRPEYVQAMVEDLHWLGIEWDEGPGARISNKDAGFGPYAQRERGRFYEDAFEKLKRLGLVYPCVCTRKELARVASAPHAEDDDEPLYPGTCRGRVVDGSGVSSWRFVVPSGVVVEFVDGAAGPQRFVGGEDFGDFLVMRRDGVPSYQLACAVDDALMGITEVVRGRDLLKSTARQILLQRALGYATPDYFHCELMVDAKGERLAKRHDALSLRALRERGVAPEQLRVMFEVVDRYSEGGG